MQGPEAGGPVAGPRKTWLGTRHGGFVGRLVRQSLVDHSLSAALVPLLAMPLTGPL
jgi:hypothetical protein